MSTDKLPSGWRLVKFGDVVRKVNDRVDPDTVGIERYVAGEHMDTDGLTIRRWGEVGDGYLGPAFHMRFKPGQVLYGSRRTYLRKVAVADFEGITANTTFVLEPSSKDLLPEFLPLVMTTEAFHGHSIKQSKGSVNPYINFSDLTWYEFALPPIDEQRQIAEDLAVFDNLVGSYEDVTHRADQLISATVEDFLRDRASSVPIVTVADVSLAGPRNGLAMRSGAETGDYVTVALSAVRDGTLELEGNLKASPFSTGEVQPYLLYGGEFLVVRGNGNRQLVGRACLVRDVVPGLFHHDKLIRVSFDPSQIDSEFALLQWNSPSVFSLLNARAKGSNGIFMVNGADLRAHRLLLPSLDEQRELVERVQRVRRIVQDSFASSIHARMARARFLNRGVVVPHVQ